MSSLAGNQSNINISTYIESAGAVASAELSSTASANYLGQGTFVDNRSVGVCWTFNLVPVKLPDMKLAPRLSSLAFSALSLKSVADEQVQRCVFTEVGPARMERLMRRLLGSNGPNLFNDVLPAGVFVPQNEDQRAGYNLTNFVFDAVSRLRSRANKTTLRAMTAYGITPSSKWRSRINRLLNLLAMPYDVTLYTDADTSWCPTALSAQYPLSSWLRALFQLPHRQPDVRMSSKRETRAEVAPNAEKARLQAANRCVTRLCEGCDGEAKTSRSASLLSTDRLPSPACLACRLRCLDATPQLVDRQGKATGKCSNLTIEGSESIDFQGGAIAVRRGEGARIFARDWISSWVETYLVPSARKWSKLLKALSLSDDSLKIAALFKTKKSHGFKPRDEIGAGGFKVFGDDQPPLTWTLTTKCASATEPNWTLSALPAAFNLRAGRAVEPCIDSNGPGACTRYWNAPFFLSHRATFFTSVASEGEKLSHKASNSSMPLVEKILPLLDALRQRVKSQCRP